MAEQLRKNELLMPVFVAGFVLVFGLLGFAVPAIQYGAVPVGEMARNIPEGGAMAAAGVTAAAVGVTIMGLVRRFRS